MTLTYTVVFDILSRNPRSDTGAVYVKKNHAEDKKYSRYEPELKIFPVTVLNVRPIKGREMRMRLLKAGFKMYQSK